MNNESFHSGFLSRIELIMAIILSAQTLWALPREGADKNDGGFMPDYSSSSRGLS